jgi:hypothetical protein
MVRWHITPSTAAAKRRGPADWRPATRRNIKALVLPAARENPDGDTAGSMGIGWPDSANAVHKGDPQDQRRLPCAATDRAAVSALQADAVLACDFFSASLAASQAHTQAVIEHAARRVRILRRYAAPGNGPASRPQLDHGPRRQSG